jgi:hypothetical protein
MTTQIKRCILFLSGNVLCTTLYGAYILSRLFSSESGFSENRSWWAIAILIFVAVQIVFRIVGMILLAILNAAQGDPEQVDREDELDKAIERKTTAITSMVFMIFTMAGLGTQAAGFPVFWLFGALAGGIVAAAITGDLANLLYYRRGY